MLFTGAAINWFWFVCRAVRDSLYIYICVCVCVCMCVRDVSNVRPNSRAASNYRPGGATRACGPNVLATAMGKVSSRTVMPVIKRLFSNYVKCVYSFRRIIFKNKYSRCDVDLSAVIICGSWCSIKKNFIIDMCHLIYSSFHLWFYVQISFDAYLMYLNFVDCKDWST